MKSIFSPEYPGVNGLLSFISLWFGFALLLLGPPPSQAVVPIPDHVIYGTIAIQNRAVTNNSAGTNVIIEAHRSSDGQLLTSYQMGSSTSQGKLFYALRVPMEDAPASSPDFAEPGDLLTLIVKKLNVVQFTSTNFPVVSGVALRMDFGASVDSDGNGAPDGWELLYFGTIGGNLNGDSDHDGVSDLAEYIAGTSPTDPSDVFRLYSTATGNNQVQISFDTRLAQGVGYEGRTRYYALETATNFAVASWRTVTNYSRIQGANQTVVYTTSATNALAPTFFRARVWLEGP
jgi:hypothetical protein